MATCASTLPILIDFYTEVPLRIAQVAFTSLYKMILKRFKERPLLYSCLCPLSLVLPVALALVWTLLCTESLGWGNNLYFILFLSTSELRPPSVTSQLPGTVFNCCISKPPLLPRLTGSSLRTGLTVSSPFGPGILNLCILFPREAKGKIYIWGLPPA